MAPKFDVYAHVTDTIIAEIEAGTPPWRKPWTGSASGIALPTRHNGEEYRGINILMLWVMAAKHGYVCSRWMTYKQAQELGGHPHAHIVLNRRSKDGEFFFLKEGHHFNYDSFREAMVEVSDRYGLRLEATRKLERGITTKRPSDVDQRRAEATGQKPTERERVGPELDRALAEVAQNARLYRGLAAEASRENQHDIAAALDKAATLLAQGKPIEANGKVYGMAEEQHSFDEVVDAFHDKINQAERIVADAPVERRAALEHELNDIYRSLSHLSPMGTQSHTLLEDASKSGIYSAANIQAEAQGTLQDSALVERLQQALKGTGIDAQDVTRRVEIGAGNAALERQWLGQDLKAIAEKEGFDLSRADQLEKAIDRLDQVHSELARVLADGEVLKDSGAAEANRQEAIVDRLPPTTADILSRMRDDPTADPFQSDLERETLRAELEELVGEEHAPDLAIGDEANRLGKMPIVLDSIETLRSYRANLAIVTQTIPALDEIYGENARRALQGNAGIKLYLTPSDEKTIEELSKAVGKTTKRVVTRSRSVGRNPFAGRSMSERTEETALLPEDEARRMDLDDIVLVVDAQMPVRAQRIKYYEDRFFKQIFDKQTGDLPYPSAGDQMRGLQGQIKALEAKIGALEVPRAVSNEGSDGGEKQREEINGLANEERGAVSGEKASLDEYQAGTDRVERFMKDATQG